MQEINPPGRAATVLPPGEGGLDLPASSSFAKTSISMESAGAFPSTSLERLARLSVRAESAVIPRSR